LSALLKAAEAAGYAAVPADDEDRGDTTVRSALPDIPAPRTLPPTKSTALATVPALSLTPSIGWPKPTAQSLTRGVYALLGRGAPA
jgi:hypothetical protein